MVYNHFVFPVGKVIGDIRGVEEIIRKILFYDMLFVARTNDEFVESIVAVKLHDMEQNWDPAQFHHGLRLELTLFTDASTESASKNYCFHSHSSLLIDSLLFRITTCTINTIRNAKTSPSILITR